MDNTNDILTLARAGYSRLEIECLLSNSQDENAGATADAAATVAIPTAAPAVAPAEYSEEKKTDFSEILQKLEKIESRINKENIKKTEINETNPQQTLGEIMATLIK